MRQVPVVSHESDEILVISPAGKLASLTVVDEVLEQADFVDPQPY